MTMFENKTGCAACSGTNDFDPQVAFARLTERVEQLANVVAQLAAGAPPPVLRAPTPEALAASSDSRRPRPPGLAPVIHRIVGGTPTSGYPECCLIGARNPNGTTGWFCTGVLVHPRIVLTAGHCFNPDHRINVVALGASNQNQLGNAELVDVMRAHVHPTYRETRRIADVTVLVLRAPAQTAPVAIASTDEIASALRTRLVGFGNSDVNSTRGFGIKREVDVDIISLRRKETDKLDADEASYGYESDIELVAGGEGFDTCNGDSGGPAYILLGAGVRKVAALTSRAIERSVTPCGEGGIYSRVDKHVAFIRSVMESAKITEFGPPGLPGL
jgi:endonuclease G